MTRVLGSDRSKFVDPLSLSLSLSLGTNRNPYNVPSTDVALRRNPDGTRVIVDSTVLLLTCTSIIVASVLIVLVWFPARIDCWLWKEDGSVLTLVCDCDMLLRE